MTGIERHFKEQRQARQAEFQRRLVALREEFSDLDLLYEPIGDSIIEVKGRPGRVFGDWTTTRWSWR